MKAASYSFVGFWAKRCHGTWSFTFFDDRKFILLLPILSFRAVFIRKELSMSAWPGGDCPRCGENMPENLIHCQSCRALLNPELESDSVHIPEFIPLPEIAAMIEATARGYYVGCPACDQELRINAKYVGQRVQCKHCETKFLLQRGKDSLLTFQAFYVACPHCNEELRIGTKYLGMKVACKKCDGRIHLLDAAPAP